MTTEPMRPDHRPEMQRMQLQYGFNEIYGWWHSSLGPNSAKIQNHLRLMDTRMVRIFVFDQPVPNPVKNWSMFAGSVQGVLNCGARPMITFAKFPPPYDDPHNIRIFVARCCDVVWGCIEQWGGDVVKDWFWCVWNEPNNLIVGGDLTFEQYRRIYEAVADAILPLLQPFLGDRKARIGGPAIDGTHRSYWMDWITRLITEVDDSKVGFVSWHRYGDWRPAVASESLALEMWGSPDSPNGPTFEALLMAQTPSYEARARGVARLIAGRDILNVCGELNAISHHENYYTLGLNQNVFGAAYYASALIHLIRGGADIEMRWTATTHTDAYGLISKDGVPAPAGLAKQLFAQHVRYGDWVRFPANRLETPGIDAIISSNGNGRLSAVYVNTTAASVDLPVATWESDLNACDTVFRLDAGTGDRVVREKFNGKVRLDRYGLAVITNDASSTVAE